MENSTKLSLLLPKTLDYPMKISVPGVGYMPIVISQEDVCLSIYLYLSIYRYIRRTERDPEKTEIERDRDREECEEIINMYLER